MQAGVDLNLTSPSGQRVQNLEVLSLINNGPDTLAIDSLAVVEMTSSDNRLRIDRDSNDVIQLGDGWERIGTSAVYNRRYEVWKNGVAEVEIEAPEPPLCLVR